MRKQGKKAIMYIMTILLVWSMVVPSLAFAEDQYMEEVKFIIDTPSGEPVKDFEAVLSVREDFGSYTQIEKYNVTDANGTFVLNNNLLDSSKRYILEVYGIEDESEYHIVYSFFGNFNSEHLVKDVPFTHYPKLPVSYKMASANYNFYDENWLEDDQYSSRFIWVGHNEVQVSSNLQLMGRVTFSQEVDSKTKMYSLEDTFKLGEIIDPTKVFWWKKVAKDAVIYLNDSFYGNELHYKTNLEGIFNTLEVKKSNELATINGTRIATGEEDAFYMPFLEASVKSDEGKIGLEYDTTEEDWEYLYVTYKEGFQAQVSIEDRKGQTIIESFTVDQLYDIQLPEELKDGYYNLVVLSENSELIKSIIGHRLPFTYGDEENIGPEVPDTPGEEKELKTIYLSKTNFNSADATLYSDKGYEIGEFKWDGSVISSTDSVVIDTNQLYTLKIIAKQNAENITLYNELKVLGSELLNSEIIDIDVMKGLHEFTFPSKASLNNELINFTVNTPENNFNEHLVNKYESNKETVKFYALPGTYYIQGTIYTEDNNRELEMITISSTDSNKEYSFKFDDIVHPSANYNGEAVEVVDSGLLKYTWTTEYEGKWTTNLQTGDYPFTHLVIKSKDNAKQYGTLLYLENTKINESAPISINNNFEGAITHISPYNSQYTISYEVKSGNALVKGVYDYTTNDYARGTVKLLNQEKTVYTNDFSLRSARSVNEQFLGVEAGKYTLEITLPVFNEDVVTMTSEIEILPTEEFIHINNLDYGSYINSKDFTISGRVKDTKNVQIDLTQKGETVKFRGEVSYPDGTFSIDFTDVEDGLYELVAQVGEITKTIFIIVDSTPPVIGRDFKVAAEDATISATWSSSSDTSHYKVEVAKNDGEYQVMSLNQKENSLSLDLPKEDTKFTIRVTAYDRAGNESTPVEKVYEYKAPEFGVTKINVTKFANPFNLLQPGTTLDIEVEASYGTGSQATAELNLGESKVQVPLFLDSESQTYKAKWPVPYGYTQLNSIQVTLTDGDDKKEVVTKELNWTMGAAIKGIISNGETIENADFRIVIDGKRYSTKSLAGGSFTLPGLPAGEYSISVHIDGYSQSFGTVKLEEGKLTNVSELLLKSYVSPTITFKDKDNNVVIDNLSVRISNPLNKFTAYGTINSKGQFESFSGQALPKLETGTYDVYIYGKGLYQDTETTFIVEKEKLNYDLQVNKLDFEEVTIDFKLPDGITSVDYVSIWSPGVAEKSNYVLNGNYFDQPTADDLKAVKVVAAKDYQIYIHKDGYKPFRLSNKDLSTNQTIEVDLVEGLKISGTVTHEGSPVNGIQVYASGSESYASAVTNDKGEYTLTGLGKDEEITLNVFNNGIYVNYSEEIGKLADHITDRKIKLSKAVNVGGKVLDADQNPLSNVSIYVTATDGQFSTWSRTATDGTFLVTGLVDNKEYTFTYSTYGLPDVTETISDLTNEQVVVMQHEPKGSLSGEGNAFAVNKSLAAPGEDVTYTLTYKNNGEAELTNVPVTLKLDSNLELVAASALLNGKPVTVSTNTITIPTVAAGESGTISFKATVNSNADVSTLTSTVDVTDGEHTASYNATTNLVFVNLNAPAQTGAKKVKVYGTAKKGATVEIYQGQKLLASTKVDSKYYYADVTLDLVDDTVASNVSLTAKVIDGSKVVYSKPVQIAYEPTLPVMEDVTVYAGWNGNVKLNPYTGLATFAITEHTPMDTAVSFKANSEVKSMTLHFLGKEYAMTKAGDAFTFNGQELGKWSSYGEQLLEVTYTTKEDVEVRVPLMNIIVLIDPSGYVFEGSMDTRLEGVQAVVETRANADSPWVKWDAQKFGQINPQITDDEGRYGWDVITGQWRVVFTKDGYIPYISRVMDVPPVETELNIPMVKAADPALKTTEIKADNLTVEFDRPMVVEPSNFELYKVSGDDRTKVDITVKAKNELNGYKSLGTTPAGKSSVEDDSNDEVGFFESDSNMKVAQSFTIAPKAKLDADATFELVVKGAAKDAEGRTLGLDTTFTFVTDVAPVVSPPTTNPPVVTPPTDDVVVIEDGKVVVSKDKLEELFASPEARIGLDLTKVTGNVLPPVVFDSEALSKMKATQSIVLQLPNQQVELPAVVLQALAKEGGQVELKVEEVTSTENGAISSQLNFNMNTYKDGKATAQTKFAAPISVSMKLNKAPKDPRKVAVFYVNGDAKTYMGGDVKDGMVTFTTDHFSSFVAVEGNKTFTDLPAYAKEAVEVLASRGIINGKTDTRYGSGDSITRAEFAVLVARSLALPTESYKGTFTDVPASMKWAAQHIEAANQAGIINGYNKTTFKPGEKINRQEMAAMIVRALKYQNPDITVDESKFVNFLDSSDISSFAKKDVAMASAMGIINGFKSGNGYEFRPKQTATRGEAAKMLFEMLY